MQLPIALIVDDDTDFRSVLGEVLADEGYRIIEAANGDEAMTVLDSLKPDVILIDLLMPIVNGWSLFALIEERHELRSVPVVFLSAVAHMAPGGGSLVLKKPLDLPELLKLLDALRSSETSSEMRLKAWPRTTPSYRLRDSRGSKVSK
jgi:two-component system OmpR family response regulator